MKKKTVCHKHFATTEVKLEMKNYFPESNINKTLRMPNI